MGLGSFLKKAAGTVIPGADVGISVGSKLLEGLFGGKSKKKQEESQRKAAIGQAELRNQMGEDTRLAKVGAGQSLLKQLVGKGFTNIDPETAAGLSQRRSYDFSKGVPEAGAGMGFGLLSGLFGGVGDLADQYMVNSGEAPMSAGQPAVPMQEAPTVGSLSDDGYYDDYKGL